MSNTNQNDLVPRIEQDMRQAMKNRDTLAVGTLKSLLARFTNAEAVAPTNLRPLTSATVASSGEGVGSTEVSRRILSQTDMQQLISDEIAEVQQVIDQLPEHHDYRQELEQKLVILRKYKA